MVFSKSACPPKTQHLHSFSCCWQMLPGIDFSCKVDRGLSVGNVLPAPYWFWAQIFSHKYCLLSPRLNYKFNQTLKTHHLNFTEQFWTPYNVGGLNFCTLSKLKNDMFIQKIPRDISSWKSPRYLALNLIMIRFKLGLFSQRHLEHLPQRK